MTNDPHNKFKKKMLYRQSSLAAHCVQSIFHHLHRFLFSNLSVWFSARFLLSSVFSLSLLASFPPCSAFSSKCTFPTSCPGQSNSTISSSIRSSSICFCSFPHSLPFAAPEYSALSLVPDVSCSTCTSVFFFCFLTFLFCIFPFFCFLFRIRLPITHPMSMHKKSIASQMRNASNVLPIPTAYGASTGSFLTARSEISKCFISTILF